MAEKLRVDVALCRLGINLLAPHPHWFLPPPGWALWAAGELLHTVSSSPKQGLSIVAPSSACTV